MKTSRLSLRSTLPASKTPTTARLAKAPQGTVTRYKDGYEPITNPRHKQDGWRDGEKVVFNEVYGEWMQLADYQAWRGRQIQPERYSAPAPFVTQRPFVRRLRF